jgi:hypothetical protein
MTIITRQGAANVNIFRLEQTSGMFALVNKFAKVNIMGCGGRSKTLD